MTLIAIIDITIKSWRKGWNNNDIYYIDHTNGMYVSFFSFGLLGMLN